MLQIVSSFIASCAAPTRRVRRILCSVCLGGAIVFIVLGVRLMDPLRSPVTVTVLWCLSLVLLALSLRLALNDVRAVREQYRRSRRDLFVATFSDEEFQHKVREKRAKLKKAKVPKE